MNIVNKEKEKINKEDMCKSFEQNVVEVLIDNVIALIKKEGVKRLVLAGGVSANTTLRKYAKQQGEKNNIEVFIPKLEYCTDNAAMIACAGFFNYKAKKYDKDLTLNATASLSIESNKRR